MRETLVRSSIAGQTIFGESLLREVLIPVAAADNGSFEHEVNHIFDDISVVTGVIFEEPLEGHGIFMCTGHTKEIFIKSVPLIWVRDQAREVVLEHGVR